MWENNIYFEAAIADFLTFLDHKTHTREEIRRKLTEIEREAIVQHGYGLKGFASALVGTFEHYAQQPVTPELHATITRFATGIAEHEIELLPGVADTVQYLAERHHIIVMTKGTVSEQIAKFEHSGLKPYFAACEVVAEKHATAYGIVVGKYGLDAARTWMVGNSPKSDINPALAAGLHAIFVPHDKTWILEHEEVAQPPRPGQRLLVCETFGQLRELF